MVRCLMVYFGKENNVKWFWREGVSKQEHLLNGYCNRYNMEDRPTDKQLALLQKRNYSGPQPQTKREASDIIGKLLGNTNSGSYQNSTFAKEKQQTVTSSVNWEPPTQEILARWQNTIDMETAAESVAYHIVRKLHPEMSVTSQTFGMIVSAKEDKLIQIRRNQLIVELGECLAHIDQSVIRHD